MSHLTRLQNLVSEVVIKTNPLYASYLNLDRIFAVIAEALAKSERAEDIGAIRYNYVSRNKVTSIYRTIIIPQPEPVPNRPYYVTDIGKGSMTGLVTVTIENWYRFEEQPKLIKDKRTGMIYEIVKPIGWI